MAVVEHRTVTGAAVALDLAPSSVSQQIRTLEGSLGVRLFHRAPTGLSLTAAGRRLAPRAARLVDDAARVRREVVGVPTPLRFGALETVMATQVPTLLSEMAASHPELPIEPVRSADRAELLRQVVAGELDAGLILDTTGELGALGFDPPVEAATLSSLDLEPCPVVLAAHPGHPLIGRRGLTVADLREHRMILGPRLCSFHLAVDLFLGPEGDRIEVPSVFVATNWAVQRLGLVLVPEFTAIEHLDAGRLVRLDLADQPPAVWLRLVWRTDREDEPGLRTLLYGATRSLPPSAA